MSVSYSWGSIPSISVQGLLGAALICALLALALHLAGSTSRNLRLAAYGIFWFLITLIPVANLVPTSTKMADRYLFLPTIGVILILLAVLSEWCGLSRMRWIITSAAVAAVAVAFTTWSYARTEVWCGETALWNGQPEPDLAIWSAAIATDPSDSLAHTNLGLAYLRLDPPNPEAALQQLQHALQLTTANQSNLAGTQHLNFTPVYEGLGDAHLTRASARNVASPADPAWKAKKDDYRDAVASYEASFQSPSGFARAEAGDLHRYSDACEALAQMDNAETQASPAGSVALRQERDRLRAKSEQALERARGLLAPTVPPSDPDYRNIVLQQGTVLFNREAGATPEEKLGYYRSALARYHQAAQLFPDDPRPLLDEGLCYERLASVATSIDQIREQVEMGDAALEKALTLSTTASDYAPATPYRVLAMLCVHAGDYAAALEWLHKARQLASASDAPIIDHDIHGLEPFVASKRTGIHQLERKR